MILLKLFYVFFKIGCFTFGGGYAMLPLVQEEVLRNAWMELSDIINFIAVSEGTPGPFAVNISTFVGMKTAGVFGAFMATLGVVLPSFIIILLVARFYEKFKSSKLIIAIMAGLKPTVVGLILASAVSVGKIVFFENKLSTEVFANAEFYISVGIFTTMFILAMKKVHPIIIIVLSAGIGVFVGLLNL